MRMLMIMMLLTCLPGSVEGRGIAELPPGTVLTLKRELSVPYGRNFILLGENRLQASFNRAFQINNQQLGRPLPGTSTRHGIPRFSSSPFQYGESVQKSYKDCKARYRKYYWRKPEVTRERLTTRKGFFSGQSYLRERWRSNRNLWSFSRQGEHPCVKPRYTYATLLVNRDEAGGTFKRGHKFTVVGVDHYTTSNSTVIDIELDCRIVPTLRVVSSEPASGLFLNQLTGNSGNPLLDFSRIGGNLFRMSLPGKQYYEQ